MLHASFPASAVGVQGDDMVSAACGRARGCQRVSHPPRGRGRTREQTREEMDEVQVLGKKNITLCRRQSKAKTSTKKESSKQLARDNNSLTLSAPRPAQSSHNARSRPLEQRRSSRGDPRRCSRKGWFQCFDPERSFDLSLETSFPVCVSRSLSRNRFDPHSRAFLVLHSMLSRRSKYTRRAREPSRDAGRNRALSLEFPPRRRN